MTTFSGKGGKKVEEFSTLHKDPIDRSKTDEGRKRYDAVMGRKKSANPLAVAPAARATDLPRERSNGESHVTGEEEERVRRRGDSPTQ